MPFSASACSTAGRSSPRRRRRRRRRGSPARRPRRASSRRAPPTGLEVITHSGVSRAECTSRLVPGMRKRPVQHHPHRRARFHARQPAGQQRIVRQHRADPDQDGVALRAQQMHPRLRAASPVIATGLRPAAPILSSADTASFRITCGRLSRMRRKCPAWSCAASAAHEPDIDGDPGGAQPRMALPRHFRIGILDRRHHARNAGGDHGIAQGGDLPKCEHGSSVT